MYKKAGFDQIRQQNRRVILQALRNEQSLARIDIGKHTGLSPAAITSITADLIREGVIKQLFQVDTKQLGSRGRPRTFLTLNAEIAYVAGIKISVNLVEFIIADYQGNTVGSTCIEFPTENNNENELTTELIDVFKTFCEKLKVPLEKLFKIAISAQGVVNSQNGTIKWSPAFSIQNIQILDPIKKKLGISCTLSNDTNLITQSIHQKYPQNYSGTFAVISIGNGVGGGVFIENSLFTGNSGAAAEFGHMNHIPNGNLCRCGKKGCLEAYLSYYGILRTAQKHNGIHNPNHIEADREKIEELVKKAMSGDKASLKAFQKAGTALGYGIARLITAIEPSKIVITGPGSKEFPLMESSMNLAIKKSIVEELHSHVQIESLPWQEDAVLNGIVNITLNDLDSEVFAKSELKPFNSKLRATYNEQLKYSENSKK